MGVSSRGRFSRPRWNRNTITIDEIAETTVDLAVDRAAAALDELPLDDKQDVEAGQPLTHTSCCCPAFQARA